MENKQTAVEWLVSQVEDFHCLLPVDMIEHAKQMEEKQIKDAWIDGFKSSAEGWNGEMLPYYKDGKQTIDEYKEEYYNETYRTC